MNCTSIKNDVNRTFLIGIPLLLLLLVAARPLVLEATAATVAVVMAVCTAVADNYCILSLVPHIANVYTCSLRALAG